MTFNPYVLTLGDEHPSYTTTWQAGDGTIINFATGYTFTVRVGNGTTAILTKTTGITGAATSPNIAVDWTTSDQAALTGGSIYALTITARRSSDNKDRTMHDIMIVRPAMA